MTKRVLIPVADGSEDIESIATVDVLRRAGAEVTVASVAGEVVTLARKTRIVADALLAEALETDYDLIALPGGLPGADNLYASDALVEALRKQDAEGRLLAAICASPALVLQKAGLIRGRRATAHPSVSDQLPNQEAIEQRVVVDGNLTTSRGPGTTLEFAVELVRQLYGDKKAAEVGKPMVLNF